MLRERFRCPHFRILVIGRANAGKTTILEKVCGVARGTKPVIYDQDGKSSQNSQMPFFFMSSYFQVEDCNLLKHI